MPLGHRQAFWRFRREHLGVGSHQWIRLSTKSFATRQYLREWRLRRSLFPVPRGSPWPLIWKACRAGVARASAVATPG